MYDDAAMRHDLRIDAVFLGLGAFAIVSSIALLNFEKQIAIALADHYFSVAEQSRGRLLPRPWRAESGFGSLIVVVRAIAWAGRGGSVLLGIGGVLLLLRGVDAIS